MVTVHLKTFQEPPGSEISETHIPTDNFPYLNKVIGHLGQIFSNENKIFTLSKNISTHSIHKICYNSFVF